MELKIADDSYEFSFLGVYKYLGYFYLGLFDIHTAQCRRYM